MATPAGGNPAAAEAKNVFESLPSPLDSIEDMRSAAALFFSSTASNGPAYVPVVTTTPAPAVSPTPTTTDSG
jgi:hypothetical protein